VFPAGVLDPQAARMRRAAACLVFSKREEGVSTGEQSAAQDRDSQLPQIARRIDRRRTGEQATHEDHLSPFEKVVLLGELGEEIQRVVWASRRDEGDRGAVAPRVPIDL
jgi:hypothetical protein